MVLEHGLDSVGRDHCTTYKLNKWTAGSTYSATVTVNNNIAGFRLELLHVPNAEKASFYIFVSKVEIYGQ